MAKSTGRTPAKTDGGPAAKKAPARKKAAAGAEPPAAAEEHASGATVVAKAPAAKKAAKAPAAKKAAAAATVKTAATPKAKGGTRRKPVDPAAAAIGAAAEAKAEDGVAKEQPAAPEAKRPRASGQGVRRKVDSGTVSALPKIDDPSLPVPTIVAARKPWLQSYPKGVPAEIGPLPHPSIGDLLIAACRQYSGRPAFTCLDRTISFNELETLSTAFGAWLQSRGLAQGARVAVMMPNVLQYPVVLMAILRAGYVVVNVNPLYVPRELEHQLVDSGAEAIVILENFAATLQAVIGSVPIRHVVVATMGDLMGLKGPLVNFVVRRVKRLVPAWSLPGHVPFRKALKEGRGKVMKPARLSPDDIAFLQYTGGTTGVAKGAVLLHRNILANLLQNDMWLGAAYEFKPKPAQLTFVCALPLYHIFALTINAVMGMQQGAHNILIPNPRDIPGLVKELRKRPFHIFPGLNTLFNALLNNEDFKSLDFKPLVLTLGGGMAIQRAVAERWKQVTGNNITEGYGLSETSPVVTANIFGDKAQIGTIGLPYPSTLVSIRDDDGDEVPLGSVGELCIRGPQLMAGYWKRQDETALVMTDDGFFKSGDMGVMDAAGFIRIVDRKKDMILVSGFNVYPNELEEIVAMHPGVLEVAAVGVADEHSGEVPKLFVVRRDPELTVEALTQYCRENFTGYKRPRYIEFRTELPKTPVGKILRRALRE